MAEAARLVPTRASALPRALPGMLRLAGALDTSRAMAASAAIGALQCGAFAMLLRPLIRLGWMIPAPAGRARAALSSSFAFRAVSRSQIAC